MSLVYDYMYRQPVETLRCFKASGATGVARYLDPFNPKGITSDEVSDIHAAGLELHLFYETIGGGPRPDLYFTHAQGAADCSAADDLLHGLGAPDGTIVYFAVDVNVEPSTITEYANGIESAQTPQITPGLYGYQRLCEYARANYPHLGRHLAQTYGTVMGPLDLWQHRQEDRCGVTVDVNDALVPGWKPKEADVAFKDDPDAQAFVTETNDTIEAIKARLAIDAHHPHFSKAAGGLTSEPLSPPVPGATFLSIDDPLQTVGWTYPDGTTHFFRQGLELKA